MNSIFEWLAEGCTMCEPWMGKEIPDWAFTGNPKGNCDHCRKDRLWRIEWIDTLAGLTLGELTLQAFDHEPRRAQIAAYLLEESEAAHAEATA